MFQILKTNLDDPNDMKQPYGFYIGEFGRYFGRVVVFHPNYCLWFGVILSG